MTSFSTDDDLYAYALITDDPTTEALIQWVDERDDADGSEQTLDWDDGSFSSEGDLVPDSDDIEGHDGAYRYEGEVIDGLDPDTEYTATIDGELDIDFRTLAESVDDYEDGQCTIVLTSDWHMEGRNDYMHDHWEARHMAEDEPKVFVFYGDMITQSHEMGASNAEEWLRFWREYYWYEFCRAQDALVPMFAVPGNHEVGNDHWTGDDSSVDPEAGYYQFWFKHPVDLDPEGENYGAVTIGDYLQLVCLDTHSAHFSDQREWLIDEDILDDGVDWIIPAQHAAWMPGGDRRDTDWEYGERMMDGIGPLYHDQPNVVTVYTGNVHARKRTVPVTFADELPDDVDEDDAYEFDEFHDGWAFEGEQRVGNIVEFGDGYNPNRYEDWINDEYWYVDVAEEVGGYYRAVITDETYYTDEVNTWGMTIRSMDHTTETTNPKVIIGPSDVADVDL